MDILIPKNEYTIKYFKRYAKFYMKGFDDLDTLICWRVEAVDSISMRGIIQISAQEYYINKDQDDVEERVVDGLILEPIEEEPSYIKGPESVKPKQAVTYTFVGARQGHWSWDKTSPIDVQVHGREATITWLKNFSGSFTIKCGDAERTIMVESLF